MFYNRKQIIYYIRILISNNSIDFRQELIRKIKENNFSLKDVKLAEHEQHNHY